MAITKSDYSLRKNINKDRFFEMFKDFEVGVVSFENRKRFGKLAFTFELNKRMIFFNRSLEQFVYELETDFKKFVEFLYSQLPEEERRGNREKYLLLRRSTKLEQITTEWLMSKERLALKKYIMKNFNFETNKLPDEKGEFNISIETDKQKIEAKGYFKDENNFGFFSKSKEDESAKLYEKNYNCLLFSMEKWSYLDAYLMKADTKNICEKINPILFEILYEKWIQNPEFRLKRIIDDSFGEKIEKFIKN